MSPFTLLSHSFEPTRNSKLMKTKSLLLVFVSLAVVGHGWSQCLEITCPDDTVFQAANNNCEGDYNYTPPEGVDLCTLTTDTISFTGSEEVFTVPAGVDTLFVELYGAQGNSNAGGIEGGFGGYAEGKILVSSGDQLSIYVGGGGTIDQNGGFNGGGDAGSAPTTSAIAGGGGGASDIRIGGNSLTDRIIVAAGGAGAGGDRVAGGSRGTGGGGGGGYYGGGGGAGFPIQGSMAQGGTQSAGGAGGVSNDDPMYDGQDGNLGIGGDGGGQGAANQIGTTVNIPGADGGGLTGENGSSAGSWTGGSGAGGSSYINGVLDGSTQSGVQSGSGKVILKWYGEPVSTTLISGLSSGSTFPAGTTTNTYEANDGNGNTETCSFNITVLPNIDTSVLVNGATLEAQNNNADYQWMDCDANTVLTGETNQLYQAEENGSYAVIVNQSGCIDTSSCHQITTVSLQENTTEQTFMVYPNPTKYEITIDANGSSSSGIISIFSTDGKKVVQHQFEEKSEIDIPIPRENGFYFLHIYGDDFYYTQKIMKQ
mgnify:CR=1 FL=1